VKILFLIDKKDSNGFIKFIESRISADYENKIVIITDDKNCIYKFSKIPAMVSIYHVRKILPKYLFESDKVVLSNPSLAKKLKKSVHNYQKICVFSKNSTGNVRNFNIKILKNFSELEKELYKNHDR